MTKLQIVNGRMRKLQVKSGGTWHYVLKVKYERAQVLVTGVSLIAVNDSPGLLETLKSDIPDQEFRIIEIDAKGKEL